MILNVQETGADLNKAFGNLPNFKGTKRLMVHPLTLCTCACAHPLLGLAVVFGRDGAIRGVGALWQVFFQSGLLVQRSVANVFVDGVYGHLSDVLRCLTEEKVTVNTAVAGLGFCRQIFQNTFRILQNTQRNT